MLDLISVSDERRPNEHHIAYPFLPEIPLMIQTCDKKSNDQHRRQQRLFNTVMCERNDHLVVVLLRANHGDQFMELCGSFVNDWKFCRQKLSFVFEDEVEGGDALQWLERMFHFLWQNKLLNVVAVLQMFGQRAQMFTYAPSTPMGFRVLNISSVVSTNAATMDGVLSNSSRVYGATLRVSMEPEELRVIRPGVNDTKAGFYGVDGDMAELVRER